MTVPAALRSVLGIAVLGVTLAGCDDEAGAPARTADRQTSTALPAPAPATTIRRARTLGRSARGRRLRVVELGDPSSARSVLVVGCIHGNECAGPAITSRLLRGAAPRDAVLWIVPDLNSDGRAAGTRVNGRGVDLNRNFPSEWRPLQRRGGPRYSGPRPLSEPETRGIARFIRARRPRVTIWFHQPQAVVRAWGRSDPAARRFARLAGAPFRRIRWPHGSAPNWQNHRFPGTSSFVVELAAGELGAVAAGGYAAAARKLATALPALQP